MSPSPPKNLNTSQYGSEHDGSSVSSRTSSPDPHQRRDSNSSGTVSTPQMNFLQKQKEMRERESQVRSDDAVLKDLKLTKISQSRNPEPPPHSPTGGFYDKPPIPPRGVPPPVPQRQSSVEKVSEVPMRQKSINGNGKLRVTSLTVSSRPLFTPKQKIITATRPRTVLIPFSNRSPVHHLWLQTEATEMGTEPRKFGCDKEKVVHQVRIDVTFALHLVNVLCRNKNSNFPRQISLRKLCLC